MSSIRTWSFGRWTPRSCCTSMPASMYSFHLGSALASVTVLALDTSSELPKSASVKAPSSLGSGTCLRVMRTVLYFACRQSSSRWRCPEGAP